MKPRILALYLPQYHPIPENDKWWGPGFTEWTNVAKAKPLFRGHVQPKIPADLGFYDLRLPETREQQAQLAREAGIEGFCYYHYWFGNGKQLLERPFNEVLASGKPDFPFCLCWANHTWSNKTWQRTSLLQDDSNFVEQTYPGHADDVQHFLSVLPAFQDPRYVKVDGKPVFFLYEPRNHPHVKEWIATWRQLAAENGLPGLYLVGMSQSTLSYKVNDDGTRTSTIPNLESSAEVFQWVLDQGFDAVNSYGKRRAEMKSDGKYLNLLKTALRRVGLPVGRTFNYPKVMRHFFVPEDKWENVIPTILPNWDRTPRRATWDGIYVNATPENFQKHLEQACDMIKEKSSEHQLLVMKSWNEWGEGNYVEPDQQFGHGYLDAIAKTLRKVAALCVASVLLAFALPLSAQDKARIIELGDFEMTKPHYTIIDKKKCFSGDAHNYESLAYYAWPDPNDANAKYIIKDGQPSPEYNNYDGVKFSRLKERLERLTNAFLQTGDEKYAACAVEQINVWFKNPSTRMNPNFNYGQFVPGMRNGLGNTGTISEAYNLTYMLDYVDQLRGKGVLPKATYKAVKRWCKDFAKWLRTSELGIEMSNKPDNHAVMYDVVNYRIAVFLSDKREQKRIENSFADLRIKDHIADDGSMTVELKRTRAYFYSIYNLEHMLDFCEMTRKQGRSYYEKQQAALDAALAYLEQFMGQHEKFKYSELNWNGLEERVKVCRQRIENLKK